MAELVLQPLCPCFREELREEGYKLTQICPICESHGVKCMIGCHPSRPDSALRPTSAPPAPPVVASSSSSRGRDVDNNTRGGGVVIDLTGSDNDDDDEAAAGRKRPRPRNDAAPPPPQKHGRREGAVPENAVVRPPRGPGGPQGAKAVQPKQRAKAMPRKQSPQGKGSAQKRGRKPAAVAPAVAAAAAAAAEPLPLPLPKAKKNGGAGAAAAAVAPAEPGAFSVPPLLASEFPDHVTAMDKLVKEVNKAVARARRHAAKAGGRGVPCVLGGDSGNYKGSETHGVWVSHDGLVKAEGQWEKFNGKDLLPHGLALLSFGLGDRAASRTDTKCFGGRVEKGMMEGRGLLEWYNGHAYFGNFRSNLRDDAGKALFVSDTEKYCGAFLEGDRHGRGAVTFLADGETYDGPWVHGTKEGDNARWEKDGIVFVGTYVKNESTGKGVQTWPPDAHGHVRKEAGKYEYNLFRSGDVEYCPVENGTKLYSGKYKNVIVGADTGFSSGKLVGMRGDGHGKLMDLRGRLLYEGTWKNDKYSEPKQ